MNKEVLTPIQIIIENHFLSLRCAVDILVTKMDINSLHSSRIESIFPGGFSSALRFIILKHIFVSYNSFNTIFILWIKSFRDSVL